MEAGTRVRSKLDASLVGHVKRVGRGPECLVKWDEAEDAMRRTSTTVEWFGDLEVIGAEQHASD